jgi:hypothetical protein
MVRIREIASEAPVTGAKVAVFFRRVGRPVEEEGGLMERQAREIHERGLYQLRQTFEEAGSYEITLNVWPGGDQTGPPLTLSFRGGGSASRRVAGQTIDDLPLCGGGSGSGGDDGLVDGALTVKKEDILREGRKWTHRRWGRRGTGGVG